jgi:hypothetical protein
MMARMKAHNVRMSGHRINKARWYYHWRKNTRRET